MSVDLILSYEQMWKMHPGVYALHPDNSVFIICDTVEVPISDVTHVTTPPLQLLKLKKNMNTLIPVERLVN